MADVVLRNLAAGSPTPDGGRLADRLEISSAGTSGWHVGEPMDLRARAALEGRGYADHGHRARAFESSWFGSTDLVVCMDRGHQQTLLGLARRWAGGDHYDGRLVMLRGFDRRAGGAMDVPDPYYGGPDGFERVLDLAMRASRGLIAQLLRGQGVERPRG